MAGFFVMEQKILIQGIEGSNHHLAVRQLPGLEKFKLLPCRNFDELFVQLGRTNDLALVAVENSLVGSILTNYMHLLNSKRHILGEFLMHISHHLMAMPGQLLEDLTEVHSHPMALAQCEQFLMKHPWLKQVATDDTAQSAKNIAQQHIYGKAAIAPLLAAELYGLEVLASNIESNQLNQTRFLLIGQEHPFSKNLCPDKASVAFNLSHHIGSLAGVLSLLAEHGINLTKIQSLPIAGTHWEYMFFVDMLYACPEDFSRAMRVIRPMCNSFTLLGAYVSADKLNNSSTMLTHDQQATTE